MAFNTNPGKQQFTATAGQTVFNFNFAIFADTDIRVYLTPAGNVANDALDILTLSIDYNVSINGTLGGTVTLLSGASINDIITIVRALPVTRTTDYVTNGDLFADTLDSDQDYQTYLVVDGYVQLQRAIIAPESLGGVSLSLPAPISNSYIRWNASANSLENDTTIPQAVLDSAASAAAALVSENAASASAASALAYLNDFKGRYYGALDSDPLLDPLGNPIDNGDIYFNTTSFELKIYSSLVWSTWTVTSAQISSIIHAATSKTTPADTDELPLLDSAASFGLKKLTFANLKATFQSIAQQDFRLTLTSGLPVTSADVTAATTLYFTQYKGNKISLYNGTAWDTIASAQMSILVPATTSQMYDVFVYNNAGVATLELTAWTNDTTRATALTYQDGILVKTGALTRRYVGSFRTTGVSGQTEDSKVKRYVWNYYNRVKRLMFRQETTASWVYTNNTYRQANGNTANQLDFVIGVSEDIVTATALNNCANTTASVYALVAVGLDVTNASSGIYSQFALPTANLNASAMSNFKGYVPDGRHFLAWLEASQALGSATFAGTTNSGIQGELLG